MSQTFHGMLDRFQEMYTVFQSFSHDWYYVLPNSLKNLRILFKKINILFDFYKSPRAVTKFVEILFHGTFTLLMLRIIETGP